MYGTLAGHLLIIMENSRVGKCAVIIGVALPFQLTSVRPIEKSMIDQGELCKAHLRTVEHTRTPQTPRS